MLGDQKEACSSDPGMQNGSLDQVGVIRNEEKHIRQRKVAGY